MKQKRHKTQPETTVHKDITREAFAQEINPEVGRKMRQLIEQIKREKSGHE
ncbi:hypothetical protein [Candidatus Pantoea multigeneris]|uniref:hypothetical protein n=1 Tax=Candidatus Pantoea multigeneris TaxID=2608357 RepID=UPI001420E88F|nr:hypothetical protein [Pantoea multigeneris]